MIKKTKWFLLLAALTLTVTCFFTTCDDGSDDDDDSPSVKEWTVTFDKNGGDTEATPKTKKVVDKKTVTLPTQPTRDGYTFTEWNTKADGEGTAFTASTPVTKSITVYAKWEQIQAGALIVTFDKNGGDTEANPKEKQVVPPATTIDALPTAPSRTGYTFTEWNTESNGSGTAFTATTPVTAPITVYAKWEQIQIQPGEHTVTFDKNGGDTEANPNQKEVAPPATTIDALPTAPSRTGHTFTEWNTKADGSGTAFTATTPVIGDIIVYAKWTPISYSITCDKNGGDTEANPKVIIITFPDDKIGDKPFVRPDRAGYLFKEWNTKADGSGTTWTTTTPVTSNVTVYAIWDKIQAGSSIVTFNKNNGDTEPLPKEKQVVPPATTIDELPNEPTRANYIFKGWNTKADGSGTSFTATTPVTTSITVYAQWTLQYTVTFNRNGGTTDASPATKTVTPPKTTVETLPTPPTRTDYVFDGWYTVSTPTGGTQFTGTTPVTADIIVYARWAAIHTVTFDKNGGTTEASPTTKKVTPPATTIDALPTPPTRTGYTFKEWNTKDDGTGTVFTDTTPVTTSITVHAQWEAAISSISVKTQPTKTTYVQNSSSDKFDPAGLEITVTKSDSTSSDVTYSSGGGFTFKNGSTTLTVGTSTFPTIGNQIITVSYQGKDTTFNITVTAAPVVSYTVTFNKNGGDTEASPTTKTVTPPATTIDALPTPPTRTGYTFKEWNTESDGSGTTPFIATTPVTATITVYAKWLQDPVTVIGISIKTPPTKTTYVIGSDTLDPAGLEITVTKSDSTSSDVTYSSGSNSGFTFKNATNTPLTVGTSTFSVLGANVITVSYEGQDTTFSITVRNPPGTAFKVTVDTTTQDVAVIPGNNGTIEYLTGNTGYTFTYGTAANSNYGNGIVRFKVNLGGTKVEDYEKVTFKWTGVSGAAASWKRLYLLASGTEGAITPYQSDAAIHALVVSTDDSDFNTSGPQVNGTSAITVTLPIVTSSTLTGQVWFSIYMHATDGAYTISDLTFVKKTPPATQVVVWKPSITTSTSIENSGEYIGNTGIQNGDTTNLTLAAITDGFTATLVGGSYKQINIQVGSGAGGTGYYADNGFTAFTGNDYTITFMASVDSGTGILRAGANNNASNWEKTQNLTDTPTEFKYSWTQATGNLKLDTGTSAVGTVINITGIQITTPSNPSKPSIVWKPSITTSTALQDSDEYIGNTGIQTGDKTNLTLAVITNGFTATLVSGSYKQINIQVGSGAGGTSYYSNVSQGFTAATGATYTITFMASVDSGTGTLRAGANNNASNWEKTQALTDTPTEFKYSWTQASGNLKLDTGTSDAGTVITITGIQITTP